MVGMILRRKDTDGIYSASPGSFAATRSLSGGHPEIPRNVVGPGCAGLGGCPRGRRPPYIFCGGHLPSLPDSLPFFFSISEASVSEAGSLFILSPVGRSDLPLGCEAPCQAQWGCKGELGLGPPS